MNIIQLLILSSWKILIPAIIAGLLSGVSSTALLATINNEVNYLSPSAGIIWSFVGLCLLRFSSHIISQILLIYYSYKTTFNLQMLLSQRIIGSPLYHLEKLGNHRILATLTSDIQAVSNIVRFLPNFCIDVAIVVSCLIYLYWLSSIVFLVILFILVIGICSYQLSARKAIAFLRLAREQSDKLFDHFRSITEGTKELKLNYKRRRKFLFEELKPTAKSSQKFNMSGMITYAVAGSYGGMLFFAGIGIVLFLIPTFNNIQTSVVSGYVLTIVFLILPLESIMLSLPVFSRAIVALRKIKSLEFTLSTYSEENLSTHFDKNLMILSSADLLCERLELLDVTHHYQNKLDGSAFTLGPINLTFSGGELVFVVGGNGSGKSTFVKVITGLYAPDTGQICLNGKLITAKTREWYRQHFSVVFSDFYLFDNCLNLGKTIPDAQIYDYLVELQLNHKVQVNNGVLSTLALSQGQRKRLALLNAYLEDRPIYIFDEWASEQDPIFRKIFYKRILPQLKRRGKTIIAITHDDRYFHLSDRIIKLDYGKVEYDKYQ